MIPYIKYGGLAFSAALTIALFVRLFGYGPYGIIMCILALVMFEGGAVAWEAVLPEAQQKQRPLCRVALVVCVGASIISSAAEIILSTGLWRSPFDIQFWTLMVIILSLGVNVLGGIGYKLLDPVVADRNRERDQQYRHREKADKLASSVIEQSFIKAEGRVREIAGGVSDALSREMQQDVINYLLSQTRDGINIAKQVSGPMSAEATPQYPQQRAVVPEQVNDIPRLPEKEPARPMNGRKPVGSEVGRDEDPLT